VHAESPYYAQKIGVTYDKKGPYPGICSMLRETLLSISEGDTNILLYPGGMEDLGVLGVKEINAGVIIGLEKNGSNYAVTLSRQDDNTALPGSGFELPGRDTVSGFQPAARKILNILKTGFPMQKQEDIKIIDVVRTGVSEFESEKPRFSLRITPGLSELISSAYLNGNVQNGGTNIENNGFSFQGDGLFRYREFNAWLGGGVFNFGNYGQTWRLHAGAGYGLFGSLFIIGADADYFHTDFYGSGLSVYNNINMPDAELDDFIVAPVLQINITKGYYIQVSFMFSPLFQGGSINPEGLPVNPPNPQGPCFIHILFNFEVIPGWRVGLDYLRYSAGLGSGSGGNSSVVSIDQIGYTFSQLGLGIEYEF
jgi:hypothetical protein